MHYHVEVGIPAGEVRDCENYQEAQERIHAEINHIMRKYDDSGEMEEHEMIEFGITPEYYEDSGDKWLVNPEGIYDWYQIGGRWKLTKVPDKEPFISDDLFLGLPYNSLHTSKLHNGCGLPMHVITWEEPYDMMSIERHEIHDDYEKMSFKEYMIAVINKTGQYDDYIWTTVDIHC